MWSREPLIVPIATPCRLRLRRALHKMLVDAIKDTPVQMEYRALPVPQELSNYQPLQAVSRVLHVQLTRGRVRRREPLIVPIATPCRLRLRRALHKMLVDVIKDTLV